RIDKKVECQEIRYADLSEGFKKEYNEKLRFIACYNIQMAELNKNSRERNIRKFENLIKETKLKGELDKIKESHYKLKSFLSKYHITKFYKLTIEKTTKDKTTQSKEKRDDYGKKEEYNIQIEKIDSAILAEANLDGRFFIQTEVSSQEFNKEEIVKSYKSLQKVEQAFKVIKNEFDIRPVYLRKDNRIRGHVMICYLALLINILLDKKMQEVFPEMENAQARKVNLKKSEHNEDDPLTMKTLMEELDTIRLIPLYINGSESPKYISTQIGRNLKKLFSSLGIINAMEPQKLRLATKEKTTNYNQLELLFT
ncbi:MAG TPA: IS1634 family transposase, partial [Ignavibacteria bacterium]|nr:IS1634 family transposase [Ignavibacteria bacterium]